MRGLEKMLWAFAFILVFILPFQCPAYGQDSVEISEVFVTDFAGNPKTIFHPRDNVRYHVAFDLNVIEKTKVVVRVSGECELLALAMCNDRKEAIELLKEVSMISGIEKAESHVVLESIKLSGRNLK